MSNPALVLVFKTVGGRSMSPSSCMALSISLKCGSSMCRVVADADAYLEKQISSNYISGYKSRRGGGGHTGGSGSTIRLEQTKFRG